MIAPNFSKKFASTSIGVECELDGFVCALPENAARCFAWVKLIDPSNPTKGEPLVQLTKDMSRGAYLNPKKHAYVLESERWKIHTVELVTYPCEKNDATAIQNRNDAVQFLLEHFMTRLATHNHEPLANEYIDPKKRFELVVDSAKHVIATGDGTFTDAEPKVLMSTSGQQATMGVRATDFGTSSNNDLCLLEKNPWFKKEFEEDFAKLPSFTKIKAAVEQEYKTEVKAEDLAKAKRVYAYLCSVIDFTTRLADKYQIAIDGYAWPQGKQPLVAGLTDPRVKNEWDVLPRTMPRLMLEILPPHVATMTNRFITERFPDTTPQNLHAAVRQYIQGKGEVVGHHINDAQVGNEQALLFEFRTIPHALKDVVPKQVTATVVVEDVMAVFKNRAAVLPVLESFVKDKKNDFRDWFLKRYNKLPERDADKIVATSSASQKAAWVKETHPAKWEELLKIGATPDPKLPLPPVGAPVSKKS